MHLPTSTYRLQFRNGMTFERAVALVPHLASLGISHLYASPIFTAVTGSTHGYDVTDANEIDPTIGGQAGFDQLADALQRSGLGLILDIVPNHMAASTENAWWRDVLQQGKNSQFADYFDIDWRERLTLPLLGQPLDDLLAENKLSLEAARQGEGLELVYYETRLPLKDGSAQEVLSQLRGDAESLSSFSSNSQAMRQMLSEQHWHLIHWKDAARHLSYRRFFEVTGLVGMRVEEEPVFEHTHRLILDLVLSGQVQGLRIDHIDGLAAPSSYLERLRHAVGPDIYLTVEKILGPDEQVSPAWPVSGTTGYEFITALAALNTDNEGLASLESGYNALSPSETMRSEGLRAAKALMIDRNFAGEAARLADLVKNAYPALPEADIAAALRELLIAFPVYRTYGEEGALDQQDKTILTEVSAKALLNLPSDAALTAISALLREPDNRHLEFRQRFQQLSGPVMAKAVEDTFFYRYNRLLALNEVGGEVEHPEIGVEAFHRMMGERAAGQPYGISTTSTHDTKRGEDARARLYTISESADDWNAAVERWRALNAQSLSSLPDGAAPEPAVEWMLYQALAGAWPDGSDDGDLPSRFSAYVEKALREAKLRTDWGTENEAYETAVLSYAAALLSPENTAFHADFQRTMEPFLQAGYVNSLTQTLIKLTAPGIPDIYQGTEGLDLSMVDPDNRRTVDYQSLARATDNPDLLADVTASMKQHMLKRILHTRKEHPGVFGEGNYQPLEIAGPQQDHLVAFARSNGKEQVVTIAPRLMFGKLRQKTLVAVPGFWSGTTIALPPDLARPMTDLLSGRKTAGGELAVEEVLAEEPVACLASF